MVQIERGSFFKCGYQNGHLSALVKKGGDSMMGRYFPYRMHPLRRSNAGRISVSGEKGLVIMRSLVEQYFANGGLVIQFNVHDAETLREAQAHPEKYENLQVRVAGWNVRWNDIPREEQDKFILRAESIAER